MTAAEDTGHIMSVVFAVVFATVFLIVPGAWLIVDEIRTRRLRRAGGVFAPLDAATMSFGGILLVGGLAGVAVRILS